MVVKVFTDQTGATWFVKKMGSTLLAKGAGRCNDHLINIARSCAAKLGITHTANGIPLEYINEHRRVWNSIWDKGQAPTVDPFKA